VEIVNLRDGKGRGYVEGFNLTGNIIRGVVGLILFGSTIYYFKSGQQIMKIISTIGFISTLIILCLLVPHWVGLSNF
jgi:hypothetical protein